MNKDNISLGPCNLCPRECGVNRKKGERGFCGADNRIMVARAALHMWEEPVISGKTGSGTVFFTGCNLRCVYCQNYDIACASVGYEVTKERLAEIFLKLQEKKACNINLVTPDMYVPDIIDAIIIARNNGLSIPIVYNGSGYEKAEVIEALKDYVDIYLTDFKYMDEELAARFSKAPDYIEVCKKALRQMHLNVGAAEFGEDGLMKRGVIVRNLLLPNHKKNTKAVIEYVYNTYGDDVYISIMNQYTPFERVTRDEKYRDIARKVTKREYELCIDYAINLGVKNAFFQEGGTAEESFIPSFDGEGVIQ